MLPAYIWNVQAEPSGHLDLDPSIAARLGIPGLSEDQCKLISASVLTQPVSPCEAALIALSIPLVKMSRKVESVSTIPPARRKKVKLMCPGVAYAPVDHYCGRPASLHSWKFTE